MDDPRLVFTDEQIKRMKEEISNEGPSDYRIIKYGELVALLARLEASEAKNAVADLHMIVESSYPSAGYCNGCQHNLPHKAGCPWNEADQVWRQVAGKDSK